MSLSRALCGPPIPIRRRNGRLEILGIPLTPLDISGFVDEVARRLNAGQRGIVLFTPDAWATSRAILDDSLLRLYREADLVTCDGVGLALAARAFGQPVPRVPGADLAWSLCARAAREGWGVYLLGGRPGIAVRAAARLQGAFPGIKVVGVQHGYFQGEGPVAEIRRLRPDMLLVGMGFPRQERWILSYRDVGAGLLIGVGGTFDLWAGRFPRAPRLIRLWGLEWLWRALVDPRRFIRLWCVPFLLYQIVVCRLRAR
jgi:N-acetylglucosaminyldiphosphoundecaprenol N-acetyl-beta-D-mannosaminyltransferase